MYKYLLVISIDLNLFDFVNYFVICWKDLLFVNLFLRFVISFGWAIYVIMKIV